MVVQWLAVCCPVLPTGVACASLSGIGWMTTSLPPFYLFSLFFPFTAYTGRRPFHHTLTCSLRTLCLSNNCSAVLRGATPLPADVGAAGTAEEIGTSFFIRLPIHPPTHHHSCF